VVFVHFFGDFVIAEIVKKIFVREGFFGLDFFGVKYFKNLRGKKIIEAFTYFCTTFHFKFCNLNKLILIHNQIFKICFLESNFTSNYFLWLNNQSFTVQFEFFPAHYSGLLAWKSRMNNHCKDYSFNVTLTNEQFYSYSTESD
jgi:hypothetical protein